MSPAIESNRFRPGRCGLVCKWLLAWCSLSALTVSAEDVVTKVRLKGGGYLTGALLPSETPERLRVQCATFEEPLEFGVEAISSMEATRANVTEVVGEHRFILSNGSALAGTLMEVDETSLTIESPTLGKVHLPRAMLRRFINNSSLGKLIYSGPTDNGEWLGTAKPTDWKYESGSLITSESGTTAVADVGLPEKSEVRVDLAWLADPVFALSIGCSKPPKAGERITTVASLEVWDGQLVMVWEGSEEADVAVVLRDLPQDRKRLELIIYLDQTRGIMAVFTPGGQLLGRLKVPDKNPTLRRLIAISNHAARGSDEELRLERCEVCQWNGVLPTESPASGGVVLLSDGRLLVGELGTLKRGQTEIAVTDNDGQAEQVPVKNIQHAIFSTSGESAGQSPESMKVELVDGSYLVGAWQRMDGDKVLFALENSDELVTFSLDHVVQLVGNAQTFQPSELSGKIGQLKSEAATLKGCLVESEGDGVLRWQALGASASSQLTATSSGSIDYQRFRSPPPNPTLPQNRGAAIRLAAPRQIVVRNGQVITQTRTSPNRKSLKTGLKLRRGDDLSAKIERIDERGVTFQSSDTSVTFMPNAEIESVTLATSRLADSQTPEELRRLMTVPRTAKHDPPTHLIISVNDDYLRGRLVKLDDERAIIEVRMEEVEVPRDRIAEIHWLHNREWQAAESNANQQGSAPLVPAERVKLQVHVQRQNERPITFVPSAFTNQTLQGNSDLLGKCRVELDNVTAVRFGADLAQSIQKAGEETWKLSLATLPKVYQESEGGQNRSDSPLVGKPAPSIELDTTAGHTFRLDEHQGRVMVLDFWASWCGPCLQTMPEVERIVGEVGGDRVDLVAVNLQETKERVRAAVERLGLTATVVLDQDGSVAQQYQATAIPQTVIIDRQGKITHVFVGGGQRFLNAFQEALTKVLETP